MGGHINNLPYHVGDIFSTLNYGKEKNKKRKSGKSLETCLRGKATPQGCSGNLYPEENYHYGIHENSWKMKHKLKGIARSRRVWLNGVELSPTKSQKFRNHSPDVFNWGYEGSGPAQLALAIILELTGESNGYQDFKSKIISSIPIGEDFEIEFELPTENEKIIHAIESNNIESLVNPSRWKIEALWMGGKIDKRKVADSTRRKVLDILESCKESR